MSYTPGPWKTSNCSAGGLLVIRGEHGKHPQSHLQVAPSEDARLIAAAPELLEALSAMLLWAGPIAGDNNDEEAAQFEMAAIEMAEKAIRKAKGEQQ